MTLSVVEAKRLLRRSGSAPSGCWLGWRERCIVLHTSFGRFEENTEIIKDHLALLNQIFALVSSVSKHVPCTFLRKVCVHLPALICEVHLQGVNTRIV